MACTYNYKGKEYTHEQLMSIVSDPSSQLGQELNNQVMVLEDSNLNFDPAIMTTDYSKYVDFKKALIDRLKDRLSKIRRQKKKASINEISNLIRLENQIKDRIEGSENTVGLEDEIKSLEANADINSIEAYVETDLARLESLIKSENPDDLKEARSLINFYNQMGKIDDATEPHPIYSKEERFFPSGSPRFTLDKIAVYKSWATRANTLGNEITMQEKKVITNMINLNTNIQKVYGDEGLTYNQIINEGKLKDINWIDMMLMDVTGGIFSTNGVIPQMMQTAVQNAFEEKLATAKTFEEKLEKILPEVEKELQRMGQGLKANFPGLSGVSYEIFKQKDKDGFETGKLIHRYSPKFFDVRKTMLFKFSGMISNAQLATTPQEKAALINHAMEWRQGWYRENTIIFDVSKLGADLNLPQFQDKFVDNDGSHRAELIKLLGEKGYKEEIAKQKQQLEKYEQEFQVWKESYLNQLGVTEANLTTQQKNNISKWEKINSPFYGSQHFHNSAPIMSGQHRVAPNMRFNISAPRQKLSKVTGADAQGNYTFTPQSTETGYYDEKYKIVEDNKALSKFMDLIMDMNRDIIDNLPADLQESISINTIPGIAKSLNEILMDKNMSIWQSLSVAAKEMWDRIKKMFSMDIQDSMSRAQVDTITGKPNYRVNDNFIKKNSKKIKLLFKIESAKIRQLSGIDLKPYTIVNVTSDPRQGPDQPMMTDQLWNTIAVYMNTDVASLKARYPTKVPLGNIMQRRLQHKVAQENSFDLPKVMKYYSTMAAQYSARNEVLPMLEAMKKHYEQIKAPSTNNVDEAITNTKTDETRLEGYRTKAIKQMDDWFNRVVLGNYGTKHAGVAKAVEDSGVNTPENKLNRVANSFSFKKKLLLANDKKLKKELDKLVENEIDPEKKQELQKELDKLGRNFSVTSVIDGMLNWIRFIGLGYNLSSSITNYLEGQISNMIIASSGDYFKPELIYPAMAATKGSMWKAVTFGKYQSKSSKKAGILMNRFRIVQDSSNELQKASSRSAFNKLEKLGPFELTRRVENLNQSPLMVALMMDTPITDSNGNQSTLWNALDDNGHLLPDFQTPDNIANWENANGQSYLEFKEKIGKMIDTAHGNYSELRGMMAKSSTVGKIAVMFKTWMTRQLYSRFATEQDDIQAGIKNYKGRYFSHSASSAAMLGGMAGFAAIGGVGLGAGVIGGMFLGNTFGVKSDLGFAKEMIYNIKALLRKAMGIPINTITILSGKKVGIAKTSNYEEFIGAKFTKRDAANMRSNITELSLLLSFIGLQLLTKMAWDAEDEEEKETHNLFMNRFMQLSGQTTTYVNPVKFTTTTLETPFIRHLGEVWKTIDAFGKWISGNDIIPTGQNAGESKFYNQLEKIGLPSVVRGGLGFEGQAEKQFEASGFDSWFYSDYKSMKKKISGQRAKRRKELRKLELTDKQINKLLKKELPLPKKPKA